MIVSWYYTVHSCCDGLQIDNWIIRLGFICGEEGVFALPWIFADPLWKMPTMYYVSEPTHGPPFLCHTPISLQIKHFKNWFWNETTEREMINLRKHLSLLCKVPECQHVFLPRSSKVGMLTVLYVQCGFLMAVFHLCSYHRMQDVSPPCQWVWSGDSLTHSQWGNLPALPSTARGLAPFCFDGSRQNFTSSVFLCYFHQETTFTTPTHL